MLFIENIDSLSAACLFGLRTRATVGPRGHSQPRPGCRPSPRFDRRNDRAVVYRVADQGDGIETVAASSGTLLRMPRWAEALDHAACAATALARNEIARVLSTG